MIATIINSADQALLERWKGEEAPLLPLLHAFQERDGYVTEAALRAVSKGLRIPLADLFGTITFYHFFRREAPQQSAARVCTGPVCCLVGGTDILKQMEEHGARPMPCAGRCDEPVPVIDGDRVLVGTSVDTLVARATPLPPRNPDNLEECIFAHIRDQGRATLEGYRKTGGYEGLAKVVNTMQPSGVVQLIQDSELTGRGGAGFPTGIKWKSVAEASGTPKSIVCNADEGEPGCFKDRAIMDHDPHAVLEGMIAAGYATGATRGFIYLRYEYPETHVVLERAIAEAEEAGLLGNAVLGSSFAFRLYVRRGAGAYICGEEGSLLNSLEGKHPFPRNRPPYPVTHGYKDLPTVVNNVETLASVPHILEHGADWYRRLGMNDQAGTKIISLSGDIRRPGNYEVPLGFPLRLLLHEWAGGPKDGRTIQAVTMAGLSGGFLAGDDLDVTLDEPSIKSKGSFLGAGGIMVFDDSRNMVEMAHSAMEFFAHESCGKCFPCRIGTHRLTERLAGAAGPEDIGEWIDEVTDIGRTMKAVSACGLGIAAPLVTDSLIKYFPGQVEAHVKSGG